MKKIYYDKLNETMYYKKLSNGLDVFMLPKNDYNKTFVVYSVKYGAMDNQYYNSEKKIVKMPSGIAHFLEHKLFAMPDDKDAMNEFSKYGANVNAFTTHNRTSYLFSTTNHLKECIDILLDFVDNPYFTDKNVAKEKGIINQEINMYRDYPEWHLSRETVKGMYKKSSIKEDVLGDLKSIKKITKELLNDCYNTFYHPENMQLFIVGKFELDIINDLKLKKSDDAFDIERLNEQDDDISNKEKVMYMDVFIPKLALGIKLKNEIRSSEEQMKYELSMGILLSMLFSTSSKIYQDLLNDKLINEGFEVYANHEKFVDFIILEGDTVFPYKLKERLFNIISDIKEYDFGITDFLRIKKAVTGKYISSLNSLEGIATTFTRFSFMNMDFFKILPILNKITLNDINTIKKTIFDTNITTTIILPKNYKNE